MKNKTTYMRSKHDKKHTYTPISSKLINNTDLSGEERFLLIFLLGRSDDFILNSSYYANNAKLHFDWGRDKFYTVWNGLQSKGYIVKKQIRNLQGKIDGHHYTVHETSDSFLKNQNPENPESGKSGFRQTSALLSIDKPTIDKPITDELSACGTTNTDLNGKSSIPAGDYETKPGLIETNDQITQVFNLIVEQNPTQYSAEWKLNDQDRKLIREAIDELGFLEAQIRVFERVQLSDKPYCSVSYIFSDLKNGKSASKDEAEVESFLKEHPELITDFSKIEFSDEKVEYARNNCIDEENFFEFIKNAVTVYHSKAKHWKPSDEDLDYCHRLLGCDSNIPLAEKLRDGLVSAFQKNDWRFGQVVYQAMTAIETKEMLYA